MKKIIVAEKPSRWNLLGEEMQVELLDPSEYLSDEFTFKGKNVKVINLCNSYHYQSTGYYVSLLAEARGHKVIPSTSTVIDFRFQGLIKEDSMDFDEIIQKLLEPFSEDLKLDINIFFGFTMDVKYSKIGTLLFNLYQSPFLKASFIKKEKWQLSNLKPLNLNDLSEDELTFTRGTLRFFLEGKKVIKANYKRRNYDLAILVNPEEETPPSNLKALQKFIKSAEQVGFNTELITKNDYGKLTQYDALFIRETTQVNHHTYRFARKAKFEGLAVVDDPDSILKCTNKVYLNELMVNNGIPVPRAFIIRKGQKNLNKIGFPFPLVIKTPDGSFSRGVKKVSNEKELKEQLSIFFKNTDMVIAQEFMPTDFDWRVGVLNGKPIYLCKYYMARNHWQIVEWKEGAKPSRLGNSETLSIDEAPHGLIQLALKATALIGKGLYGVDIKQVKNKFFIIEVNDNPSIDAGIEDKKEKNHLFKAIMDYLLSLVINKQQRA